jgi:hypothetical protein
MVSSARKARFRKPGQRARIGRTKISEATPGKNGKKINGHGHRGSTPGHIARLISARMKRAAQTNRNAPSVVVTPADRSEWRTASLPKVVLQRVVEYADRKRAHALAKARRGQKHHGGGQCPHVGFRDGLGNREEQGLPRMMPS